jgi:hypothetical protein
MEIIHQVTQVSTAYKQLIITRKRNHSFGVNKARIVDIYFLTLTSIPESSSMIVAKITPHCKKERKTNVS